jgi:short-subunit dehydrogenase involved in D-alanine esterification of teichoic acids
VIVFASRRILFFLFFIFLSELWALISNAGVLVCGEFFWQTEEQWHRQINVNFWGAVNLTKEFQPLLFFHQCKTLMNLVEKCFLSDSFSKNVKPNNTSS